MEAALALCSEPRLLRAAWWIGAGVCIGGAAWLLRRWASSSWGRCAPGGPNSLRGRTAIVTGASGGLGERTARELALRGARVVLACRDLHKARRIVADLRKAHPHAGEMIVMHLDLESFESVRSFAELVKTGFSKIDILVNNAGVYLPSKTYQITRDGHEMHFGVNHLSHFLLTNLLLDHLKKASPSRVVIVSSTLHEHGKIPFDDINLRSFFEGVKSGKNKVGRHNPGYCNSKLMNVYHGRELAERTKGTGVDVFILCPGFVRTQLFRHSLRWFHFIIMAPFLLFFMRTPEQGSQTILHCATEPSLEGKSGGFYRNCAPYHSKVMFDRETQEKLWEVSEELVNPAKFKLG